MVPILILSVKPSSLSIFRDAGPLTNWPLSVSEGAKCSVPSIGAKGRGSTSTSCFLFVFFECLDRDGRMKPSEALDVKLQGLEQLDAVKD